MPRDWFSNNHEGIHPDAPFLPTLYIAGPMTGIEAFNYPAFDKAAVDLRRRGYTVLNPTAIDADNPTPGKKQPWEWYMRKALQMLLRAQAVAVLPGWNESKGARLEVRVAHGLGMQIEELAHWLEQLEPGHSIAADLRAQRSGA